jgi:hypothetical protein
MLGVASFTFLLFLFLVVAASVRAASLYADGQAAAAQLRGAITTAEAHGFELTAADAEAATSEMARADASLSRISAALARDPLLAAARLVPGFGSQLDAASRLIRAMRLITSRHDEVRELLLGYVAAQRGTTGADRLAAIVHFMADAGPPTTDLVAAFHEAESLVEGTPTVGLLGPIASVRAAMAAEANRADPLVAAWQLAEQIVPAALGSDGARRYLILALDSAEVRPVGGLIAAYATPTFTAGRLADFTFHDILDIDRAGQATYVKPPAALAGHLLGELPWQVADAGWWPDFAQSAAEARRLYTLETGDADLNGTIAFTPAVVDALLKIVGPVQIPGAGITVHAGETYLVSLQQVEILHQGAARKQFLADLASEVVKRLFALPVSRYPEVISALDQAAKRRDLQVIVDDPSTQTALDELGWYTPFSFPAGSDRLSIMEANVAPVSKLDVLLTLDHSLTVNLTTSGNADERLVTTFTNGFAPNLPPALEAVAEAFGTGNLGSYQRRYIVPDATGISVSSDGMPPLTGPERVEATPGALSIRNYQLIRPGVTHLVTSYLAPHVVSSPTDPAHEGTYHLSFFKQPGRDGDTLTVSVVVPPGTHPVSWSAGGSVAGNTVTFRTTTEFDRTFAVSYAAN